LLAALDDPWELRELRYVAQASMGIALAPEHGDTAEVLLRNADIAMYRAKAGGRGRICFFDSTMSDDATERFRLENLLRRAVENDEIRLHYQPEMDGDGRPVAVEALARWQTHSGEWIPPGVFIPVAEETGLIVPMGAALLRQATHQMRRWRERNVAVGYMAINVSVLQMRDPAFPQFVRECLAENDLPGSALQLEVTESLLADDPAEIVKQLQELRSLGVSIAIDDFGTGFSSMSLLRDYPISALKIDRSFVLDCAVSERSRTLIKALIDVGHALKLDVVAEGIEDPAQLAVLRALGCDVMQGYLFSAALSPEKVGAFFRGHCAAADLRDAV
jgi:EAL domain-containing protein (putative c-di-GMP-specific phosphodiesterase class I)